MIDRPRAPALARSAAQRKLQRMDALAMALLAILVWLPLLVAVQGLPPERAIPARAAEPPAQPSPERKAPEEHPQGPEVFLDVRVTDYLLVAAGFLQVVLIYMQIRIAARQAGISADQSALLAQIERPLMLINGIAWEQRGWNDAPDKRIFPRLVVTLGSHGRSAAIIDRCQIGAVVGTATPERRVGADGALSAVWRDHRGVTKLALYASSYRYGAMRSGDEAWRLPCEELHLDGAQIQAIGAGSARVWVDGMVTYRDAGGRSYETQFRYVYDPAADFFLPDESAPEFNRHT